MPLRVVVYAEGVGELAKECPAPGTRLEPEHLGPAHILAQRSLEQSRRIPARAIVFEQGLRTNARVPRGSDLHRDRTLRRLLEWPFAETRPDVALVFVDEDDEKARHARLVESIAELHSARPPTVIAVARKEFEAWLVTDRTCLATELERTIDDRGNPEGWDPKEAKAWLNELLEEGLATVSARFEARRRICRNCDLEELRRKSDSYRRFHEELVALPLP